MTAADLSYDHYRRIIEHCLEHYHKQRTHIARRHRISAEEVDFELFLAAYRIMEADGRTDEKEALLLATLAEFAGWPPSKLDTFWARASRRSRGQWTDFAVIPAYPELAVSAARLAYAVAHIDGEFHETEERILADLKAHLLAPMAREGRKDTAQRLDVLLGLVRGGEHLPDDLEHGAKPEAAEPGGVGEEFGGAPVEAPADETLEDCLAELHGLVGLRAVKEEVERLVRFLQVQKTREEHGLPVQRISLHMVFTGNPGTGKTTVGRLVSRLFRAMGILKSGHLVETDRAGLVGSYVGHTAPRTLEVARKALDGVLFVDEAYALTRGTESDFGKEAIDTLVKFMEDHRDRLVVIVAGYEDEMRMFIDSNPGLKSRFATVIHFPDFSVTELVEMFQHRCRDNGYKLTPEAEEKLRGYLARAVARADRGFGNGRHVRNLFEDAIKNQAFRLLATTSELTRDELMNLIPEDIEAR